MIRSKIDGGWFCVIVHPTIDDPWWMMMMMRVLVMELSRKNYKFITFKRSKDKEEGIRGRGHDRCLLARQVFSLNWFSWIMINFNYPCSFMLCFAGCLLACLSFHSPSHMADSLLPFIAPRKHTDCISYGIHIGLA